MCLSGDGGEVPHPDPPPPRLQASFSCSKTKRILSHPLVRVRQVMTLPSHPAFVDTFSASLPVRGRERNAVAAVDHTEGGSVSAGDAGDRVFCPKRPRCWSDVDGGGGLNATQKDAKLLQLGISHFGKGPEGVGKLKGFFRWKNGGTESRSNKEGRTYRTLLCAYSVEAGCPFCIRVVEQDGVYTIQDGGRVHSDHSKRVGDRKVLFTPPSA